MYGAGARKIMEARLREPAASPDPVGLDGIDQSGNNRRVDTVGQKPGSLGHGTGHNSGRGGAEYQIEHKV